MLENIKGLPLDMMRCIEVVRSDMCSFISMKWIQVSQIFSELLVVVKRRIKVAAH